MRAVDICLVVVMLAAMDTVTETAWSKVSVRPCRCVVRTCVEKQMDAHKRRLAIAEAQARLFDDPARPSGSDVPLLLQSLCA